MNRKPRLGPPAALGEPAGSATTEPPDGRGSVTWAGRGGAASAPRRIARCDALPEAGRALKMAAGTPSGSAGQ